MFLILQVRKYEELRNRKRFYSLIPINLIFSLLESPGRCFNRFNCCFGVLLSLSTLRSSACFLRVAFSSFPLLILYLPSSWQPGNQSTQHTFYFYLYLDRFFYNKRYKPISCRCYILLLLTRGLLVLCIVGNMYSSYRFLYTFS